MTEADDIRRVADQIAAQLGERAMPPVLQIRRIVKVLGVERAQAFAREGCSPSSAATSAQRPEHRT